MKIVNLIYDLKVSVTEVNDHTLVLKIIDKKKNKMKLTIWESGIPKIKILPSLSPNISGDRVGRDMCKFTNLSYPLIHLSSS